MIHSLVLITLTGAGKYILTNIVAIERERNLRVKPVTVLEFPLALDEAAEE